MNVSLSEDRAEFIRRLVSGGWYASETAVLEEALRLLEQRDQEREQMETLLIEGLDSGASSPMTAEDWDEVEREGQRHIAARQERNVG